MNQNESRIEPTISLTYIAANQVLACLVDTELRNAVWKPSQALCLGENRAFGGESPCDPDLNSMHLSAEWA